MEKDREERLTKLGITIMAIGVAVILIGILSITQSFISGYNSIVELQENIKLTKSLVETQIQARSNLIPDLVETVQAYDKHEEKVFADIANARAALADSLDTDDINEIHQADQEVGIQISELKNFVVENYPTLASSELYTTLMDEMTASANKITTAKVYYNEAVWKYNKKIKTFPGNIWAKIYEFEEIDQIDNLSYADF